MHVVYCYTKSIIYVMYSIYMITLNTNIILTKGVRFLILYTLNKLFFLAKKLLLLFFLLSSTIYIYIVCVCDDRPSISLFLYEIHKIEDYYNKKEPYIYSHIYIHRKRYIKNKYIPTYIYIYIYKI